MAYYNGKKVIAVVKTVGEEPQPPEDNTNVDVGYVASTTLDEYGRQIINFSTSPNAANGRKVGLIQTEDGILAFTDIGG